MEKPQHSKRVARYLSFPLSDTGSMVSHARIAATVPTIPVWQASDAGYTYQMVGASPLNPGAGTTTITTNVVPLILTFADGTTFDPTVSGNCSAQPPQSLVLSSPIFNNFVYTAGSVGVGNTQYLDFFQRANFWQYAGPNGISPNYHILLSASPLAGMKISVPASSGSTSAAACGRLGEVDINWLDSYLQGTLFPKLAGLGVTPSNFPVFVLSNVVLYQGTSSNCCILGYHSGFNNPSFSGAAQTYAVADFETSGDFGATKDISALTHEVGEWLDDPTGGNPTPQWGNIGQVHGCQNNLENGDPLSGTVVPVTMSNGYVYHVQELAFKSWFYHDAPSSGVNGWYSSNGTFRSYAAPCGTSTTSLTINPTSIATGSATTIKVTVAAGSSSTGTPTGSVSLVPSNNSTPLATYTLSAGAVNTTATLPAGSYTVTARYAGDLNFAASSSPAVAVTVGSSAVTLSPVSLVFPGQNLGTSSAGQSVSFSNKGTAPLSIASISLGGASPGDFSKTSNCGASLAVNASCTITVSFRPTATGTRTAALSIADSATGSPQTVPLSGTGTGATAPQLTLTPASLTFAATAIGVATSGQTVIVRNTGAAPLTFTSLSLSGTNPADFSGSTSCTGNLAINGSCQISIAFKPTAAGSRTASVIIVDSAPGSPQNVPLSGTGLAAAKAVLSSTAMNFAATPVNTVSAAARITLINTGGSPLSIASVSVSGANPGDFLQTSNCGSSLAPDAGCTVSLTFRPSAKGPRAALLTVTSNSPGVTPPIVLAGVGK